MAQQCDVERQPEAVLRAPARTDQIKIIIGQKIVALQRSDVGGNPDVALRAPMPVQDVVKPLARPGKNDGSGFETV